MFIAETFFKVHEVFRKIPSIPQFAYSMLFWLKRCSPMYLDSHLISYCTPSFQICPEVTYPLRNPVFHPTLSESTLVCLILRDRRSFKWNHLKGLNERWDAKLGQVIQMSLQEKAFSTTGHKSGIALAMSLERQKSHFCKTRRKSIQSARYWSRICQRSVHLYTATWSSYAHFDEWNRTWWRK